MVHPFRKQQNILHFEARIQSHLEEFCMLISFSRCDRKCCRRWHLALVKKSRDELRLLDNQSHNGILHIKTVAVQNTIGRDDDDRTTCRRAAGVLISLLLLHGVGLPFRWVVEVGCWVVELNKLLINKYAYYYSLLHAQR